VPLKLIESGVAGATAPVKFVPVPDQRRSVITPVAGSIYLNSAYSWFAIGIIVTGLSLTFAVIGKLKTELFGVPTRAGSLTLTLPVGKVVNPVN
jgi:hypothetical protein